MSKTLVVCDFCRFATMQSPDVPSTEFFGLVDSGGRDCGARGYWRRRRCTRGALTEYREPEETCRDKCDEQGSIFQITFQYVQ